MKKLKICSIIFTALSVVGIFLSIVKLVMQYKGIAILSHTGGSEGSFVAVKAGDSFLVYIITIVLILISTMLWLLYKKKRG